MEPSPAREGTMSKVPPQREKKRVAYTKMLINYPWVMKLQAIFVLFLCAFLHCIYAT